MEFTMTPSVFRHVALDMRETFAASDLPRCAAAIDAASHDSDYERVFTLDAAELADVVSRAYPIVDYVRAMVRTQEPAVSGLAVNGYVTTGLVVDSTADRFVTIDVGINLRDKRDFPLIHPAERFIDYMDGKAFESPKIGDFVSVTYDIPRPDEIPLRSMGLRGRVEGWDRSTPRRWEDSRAWLVDEIGISELRPTYGEESKGFNRVGSTLYVSEKYVYQDLGRGVVAEHERNKLLSLPTAGDNVRIEYQVWPHATVRDMTHGRELGENISRSEMGR